MQHHTTVSSSLVLLKNFRGFFENDVVESLPLSIYRHKAFAVLSGSTRFTAFASFENESVPRYLSTSEESCDAVLDK